MRSSILRLLFLCTVILLASAWSKEDHELFRLKDEVELDQGAGTNFYDFLGISAEASLHDINKALRKKSLILHPDKVKHNFVSSESTRRPKKGGKPGVHVSMGPTDREVKRAVREAAERYARLGVVANALKSQSTRERYDHFLRYGFPNWRGTGYYYERYRPGLGTVLLGLFLVMGGGAHWLALSISYKNQVQLMEKYMKHARKEAWGSESSIASIPGVGDAVDVPPPTEEEPDPMANLNRRQRREYERQNKKDKTGKTKPTKPAPAATSPPSAERRRVRAENGKSFVVDKMGDVYLEEEDEDGETHEFLLDTADIPKPTVWDTAVVRLPIWLYRKAADPFLKDTKPVAELEDSSAITSESLAETVASVIVPEKQTATEMLSSSQMSDFEMVDSTGIENEIEKATAGNGVKRRGKKGKK